MNNINDYEINNTLESKDNIISLEECDNKQEDIKQKTLIDKTPYLIPRPKVKLNYNRLI